MRLVAAAFLLLGATLRATAQQAGPDVPKGGKDVVLATPDGMKLAATHWHPEFPSGAGAVLLHMYRRDRTAWHPLVEHLTARGMDVLAVDMRGHGGSAKQGAADLTDRVAERDPALFAEMHRDAYAAVRWLVLEAKCALLLMTHAEEADVGAKALAAAVKHARLLVYDEKRPADVEDGWAHGTRMFGRIALAARTVASFLAARTGSRTDDVVLDGIVEEEAKPGGPWTRAGKIPVEGEPGTAWAYCVGRRLVFGGTATPESRCVTWTVRLPAELERPAGAPPGLELPLLNLPLDFTLDLVMGRAVSATVGTKEREDAGAGGDDKKLLQHFYWGLPDVRVRRSELGAEYEGEWILRPGATDAVRVRDEPHVSVSVSRDELTRDGPRVPPHDARRIDGVPIPVR